MASPTSTETLIQYCRRLPKVVGKLSRKELHAHLNGSISPSTMTKLVQLRALKQDGCDLTIPSTWQTNLVTEKERTLDECFEMFRIIHNIVDNEEAVTMVAHDVVIDFAKDGVVYLELRTTPRANDAKGMSKRAYIEAVLSGMDSAITECEHTIFVRLLLSIDRRKGIEEARDTVLLAEQYMKFPGHHQVKVVGIDFSGDPSADAVAEYLPVLLSVKEKGLKLTIHISEIPDRNAETLLLLSCNPDRIGHGTFLLPDVGGTHEIIDVISSNRIPLEICLTSNLKVQTVPSYDMHHLGVWYSKKHPIVICTDDKGVFSTSLSEEYSIASQTFSLSRKELFEISLKAVDYIFDENIKKELINFWSSYQY